MKEFPFKHLISKAETLEDLSDELAWYLAVVEIFEVNGSEEIGLYLERASVQRIGNLKIEIRTKERCHNIPHFHVISPDINASFTIVGCDLIAGEIDKKAMRKINRFFNKEGGKQVLIEFWNNTRPTDLPALSPLSPTATDI